MGEMSRPKPEVLPASSLIPDANLIAPAPNQFTHEIVRRAPFYYAAADEERPPDGTFERGTPVVLLHDGGGGRCYVADGRGLYVVVDRKALRRLGSD